VIYFRRFVALVASPALLLAAKNQDWKTGKVLDSATAKTYVQTGATTNTTVNTAGNGADATVIDADGKECKTEVLRQERLK
jgi:hypothetical protein